MMDAAGKVLRPAILWNDQRTAEECDEITRLLGFDRLLEICGNKALTGFTAPKSSGYANTNRKSMPKPRISCFPKIMCATI
jgi:xylulokinase